MCRRKALRLQEAIFNFYKLENKPVSLVIVGDRRMRTINKQYRGKDKTTDVLTFRLENNINSKSLEDTLLGEIFINIDEAKRTEKYLELLGAKKSYSYIFYFLFVHGLLHLLGYDDKTEKERLAMVELGKKFMAKYYH